MKTTLLKIGFCFGAAVLTGALVISILKSEPSEPLTEEEEEELEREAAFDAADELLNELGKGWR